MNGPFDTPPPQTVTALPIEFQALCPAPQLPPGESLDHSHALQAAIFRDIAPHATEWLLAIDIAELSWEVQRYRVLRHRLLNAYRQKAIEMTLRRIDVVGIAPELQGNAELYIVQNALDWQLDPIAAHDIEAASRPMALINIPSVWKSTSRRARFSPSLKHCSTARSFDAYSC